MNESETAGSTDSIARDSIATGDRAAGDRAAGDRAAGDRAAGDRATGSDLIANGDPATGSDLIAGIRHDAQTEAERLIEEARKAAAERLQAAEAQAAGILEEARGKAEAQAKAVQAQAVSASRMEARRTSLKVREEALRRVLQAVRERLGALATAPEGREGGYRDVLLGWIVEAAIGLNGLEATVNVSTPERRFLDKELLGEAQAHVQRLTGRKVALTPAKADPLVGQGVVLRSGDGRLEFNNQLSTRLLRYQSEIRKTMFEALDR